MAAEIIDWSSIVFVKLYSFTIKHDTSGHALQRFPKDEECVFTTEEDMIKAGASVKYPWFVTESFTRVAAKLGNSYHLLGQPVKLNLYTRPSLFWDTYAT